MGTLDRRVASSLDVIIVNWNAGDQLRECLESLDDAGVGIDLRRVVVVDNASTDASLDRLLTSRRPVTIVRNAENRGFAAACNQGAQGSDASYLLFLNPDTRLHPDALRRALEFMEDPQSVEVGICGIQLVDAGSRVSRTCARFPEVRHFVSQAVGLDRLLKRGAFSCPMVEWDHRQSREVDHVIGAFFLVRAPLFERLNGFDERFFVYLEDLDFSYRARRAGFRSYYLASAQAYHRGGGTSEQAKAARLFYSLRSRLLYAFKHFGVVPATLVLVSTLVLEPAVRLAYRGAGRSMAEMGETARAYAMLYSSLPTTLRAARVHGRTAA